MVLIKQPHSRRFTICKFFMVIISISIVLILTVRLYTSLLPSYLIVNLSTTHSNIIFTRDRVYFLTGVAYDFYSIDEFVNHSTEASTQWKTFPLPNEHLPPNTIAWTPPHHPTSKQTTSISMLSSPLTTTGLAFVDQIYITSTPQLKDRQNNLKRMFSQYNITNYQWRMKWARDTCNSPEHKDELYRKANLRAKSIGSTKIQRQCAITMEHIDIWHDIIAHNFSLSLILEDDAVFVSHFREKFDRTIYTAIRTGALKLDRLTRCTKDQSRLLKNKNEWFEQDPMIVIGSCMQMYDSNFLKNRRDAQPILSTHKESSSRCSHAYLLTTCSAQALIRQISIRKNIFVQSDLLLNTLVAGSPTLQSFWLDPPIVYQGNRINDLDGIPSFKSTTY